MEINVYQRYFEAELEKERELRNELEKKNKEIVEKIEEVEDDGEPFEEKMTRLTTELYGLFEESHSLESEIRKKLEAIGYGE